MNTITSPTLLGEQTWALKKHFLDLKHLKHPVQKLSALTSSSPKVRALEILPFQEEVPRLTEVLPVSKSLLLAASRSLFRAMEERKQLLESTEEKYTFPYRNIPPRARAQVRGQITLLLAPENGKQTKAPGKDGSPHLLPKPASGPPTPDGHPPPAAPGRFPSRPPNRADLPPAARAELPEGRAVPPLTVRLLARGPQPAVEAGGPTQAAGRDLARGLLPLPQDVQVTEGCARS